MNYFLTGNIGCFQFKLKTFSLCLIEVDQHFDTSHSLTLKGVTFLIIPIEKAARNLQTVTPVLFHELLWNQPCTNVTEAKSVADDFIDRTVTNLQLICQFIDNQLPTVEN
jgi:hypothetical protein